MHALIGAPSRKEIERASDTERRLKRVEMRQKVLEQHVQYLISAREREKMERFISADKDDQVDA